MLPWFCRECIKAFRHGAGDTCCRRRSPTAFTGASNVSGGRLKVTRTGGWDACCRRRSPAAFTGPSKVSGGRLKDAEDSSGEVGAVSVDEAEREVGRGAALRLVHRVGDPSASATKCSCLWSGGQASWRCTR